MGRIEGNERELEGVGNGEKMPRLRRVWSVITRTWLLLRGR